MRLWMLLAFSLSLAAKPLELDVNARSAILMNADTGAVLYEKHAHIPLSPASITKIATALYILEKGTDLNRAVMVSAESLKHKPIPERDRYPSHWLESDGTMMGIKRGEVLTLDALLHGLILVSGNDAANVLAESVGGNVPAFMASLNEYLQGMGCQNTRFSNPHGLTHPEHYTTAHDMALITQKALRLPKFRQLVSTLVYSKAKTNKQPALELKLTNPLLKPKSRYYYPKAIGVKTGHTSDAQDTLVAAAEHEGRCLIAVILGSPKKTGARYEDAKRLFEMAFAQKKETRKLIGPDYLFTKEVTGSKTPLKASLAKTLSIDYFPAEEPQCKAALHWSGGSLPIRKGQKVGEVYIQDERGQLLQKGDLIAAEEVKGSLLFVLKEKVSSLLGISR
jgi:D-alanyl-D-alanine carboxypeptidase (penicillin-binding protein 5/6)